MDLMSVELVCQRWHWIQQIACRSVKKLSLLDKGLFEVLRSDITRFWYFSDYRMPVKFEDTCLVVNGPIRAAGVEWLVNRFSRVTKLSLYGGDNLDVEHFVMLMKSWPDMEELIMFGHSPQWSLDYNCNAFWTALNSLKSLRFLRFPFGSEEQLSLTKLEPLFRKLETIYLKNNTPLGAHKWSAETNVKQFFIHKTDGLIGNYLIGFEFEEPATPESGPKPVVKHFSWTAPYTRDIVRELGREADLPLIDQAYELDMARVFTGAMLRDMREYRPTITHLDIEFASTVRLTIAPYLYEINQLPNLTSLRLVARRNSVGGISLFSDLTRRNYGELLTTTIGSVRTLHLSKFDISPITCIFRYIQKIFPNIESLHLEDCALDSKAPLWLLTAFQNFSHLTKVYHNNCLALELNPQEDRKTPVYSKAMHEADRILLQKTKHMLRNNSRF